MSSRDATPGTSARLARRHVVVVHRGRNRMAAIINFFFKFNSKETLDLNVWIKNGEVQPQTQTT
jgi:hypothetical protein